MVLRVTDDKKFLQVTSSTQHEIEQLEFSMTKKVDNFFIIRKKMPHWDGEIKFMDRYLRIPIGLWQEIKNICTKFHFPLNIEGIDYLYDKNFNSDAFKTWALEYFKNSEKYNLRDYQLEGATRIIKFRNCIEEISNS